MRALATFNNAITSADKLTIVRNLNRICDIAILDIDAKYGTITFLHSSKKALENVIRELKSIGYPAQNVQIKNGEKGKFSALKSFG